MGGYSQPWSEQTGISELDDPGGFRRRRGLLGQMDASGPGAAVSSQPRTSESPKLVDRISDDTTRHPTGETYPDLDYSSLNMSGPDSSPKRSMSSDLDNWLKSRQAEYDQLSQPVQREPMSTKSKILRGIMLAAPTAIGAATGGGFGALAGASGTLGGYAEAEQRRQNREDSQNAQRIQERGRLSTDIGNVMRTREMEESADKRLTLQQQMESERERERQASQERVFGQQNQLEATREAGRQKTLHEQIDEQNKRQTAQFGEQEKLQGMRDAAADRRQQASDARRDKADTMKWQQVASKRYETAMDADQRLSRMEASYAKGLKGDQQAMLALLTDHIGMTLGMQKGARITKDILQEATASQPWLAKIGAKFDNRGYLSGVTLGPDQMRQMLELGYGARDRAVQGATDESQLYGVAPPPGAGAVFGKRKMGEMPAIQQGGVNEPPRPPNVPAGYIYKENGPKGTGWYKP